MVRNEPKIVNDLFQEYMQHPVSTLIYPELELCDKNNKNVNAQNTTQLN